jgi:hypothetical protein
MTCVNINAMTTTSGTPSNQRMIGMITSIAIRIAIDPHGSISFDNSTYEQWFQPSKQLATTTALGTNFIERTLTAAHFNKRDHVMPILVWIATVACMWEIASAGIHLRPADEPRASEAEPRLARPARRPPADS